MACGCDGNVFCLVHKLAYWRERGLNIAPSATPNRHNRQARPPSESANAWERGVPVDGRNMPQLGPDLKPVGNKRYAEIRRQIEDRKRAHHRPPS